MSCFIFLCLFFFFFQAEDGIRDYKVTGVQTCALPISQRRGRYPRRRGRARVARGTAARDDHAHVREGNLTPAARQARTRPWRRHERQRDRKSTRLNSSHLVISYAVFCLKKKNRCARPGRPYTAHRKPTRLE